MKKMMIISGSRNVLKIPTHPIPAIERFNGGFVKQLRSHYRQLKDIDVLILSPIYGLVRAEEKIRFKPPIDTKNDYLTLSDDELDEFKKTSLAKLQHMLGKTQYNEIYVNLGRYWSSVIEGLELIVPKSTKITYSKGTGMGNKMAHMRDWLKANTEL